ncbi:unnamed protein product, partial [Mesorhabditis belari]|uniref:Uncharacterized protein n=1 Tax=Mesorhabditis belari TaxID=2138241 RepID=A0AAF3J502_9BILA
MVWQYYREQEFCGMEIAEYTIEPTIASPVKLCRVCDDKSDGAHFGVESCRACAAFFRRSVVMRKKYICRQGGENCQINKTVRCMCRCCRFNKCLKMGMMKDAVQSPRDQIGKRSEQQQQQYAEIKQEHADSTSGYYDPLHCEQPLLDSWDVYITEEVAMPILKKIQAGYNELRARRAQYRYEVPMEPITMDTDLNVPRRITHKHGFRMLAHDNENIVKFMRSSFPRLNEFDQLQRKVLYRSCFASYMLFDSAYRTYLQSGDENDRWYISDGNYIDMADVGYYYSAFEGSSLSHADASSLFRPTFSMFVRNILQPMKLLRMTDMEFFALIALTFYSHGADGGTGETDQKAMEVRDAILRELTFYYTRFACFKDYPLRMAQVMLMLPSIHRITTRFREDVEINKLFNTDFGDEKIYDLINGKGQI